MSAGVVLAAGEGRRFGGPKQLALLDGRPLVEHALAALAGLDRVVVVLGAHADEVRRGADLGAAEVVVCDGWEEGMGASLRAGLAALRGADEVVIRSPTSRSSVPRSSSGCARRPARRRAPSTAASRAIRSWSAARCSSARASCAETKASATLLGGAAEVECSELADPRDIDTREDLEVVRR